MRPVPQGGTERRAGGINGILRRGRSGEEPSGRHHPTPLTLTITSAVRRVWTASLVAVFALVCVSARPALAQSQVVVVTDPDGVNLRGGPGTNYISLDVIPKGAELPVLGPKLAVNWIPVSYQGKMGFVFDEYVEVKTVLAPALTPPSAPLPLPGAIPLVLATTAAPSPSPSPSASPAMQTQLKVNSSDGLNQRAAPSMEARVLGVIPHQTRVTVTSRTPDGKWSAVTYAGQAGWVDSQYLVPADAAVESRPDTSCAGAPAGSRFIWPVCGRSITTYFGPSHLGIDIDQFPAGGNPVVAIAPGKVVFAGGNPCCSYGLYVKVEHKDGIVSLYAHLQSFEVREGQEVTQGQSLGKSGNTGFSTGAHLHFELHMNGSPVDPLGQLPRP